MTQYPKPGTPEFARLPAHVQKRIIDDLADRHAYRQNGFLGKTPNAGATHIRADKCPAFPTGRIFVGNRAK